MNTLRLQLRFLVPLVLALAAAAWLTVPVVDRLTLRWFARDLSLRGELVANTLSDSIGQALEDRQSSKLDALFARVVQDERLVAIGLCSQDDRLLRRTSAFPTGMRCAEARSIAALPSPVAQIEGGPVHVGLYPVKNEQGRIADMVLPKSSSLADLDTEQLRQALGLRDAHVLTDDEAGPGPGSSGEEAA